MASVASPVDSSVAMPAASSPSKLRRLAIILAVELPLLAAVVGVVWVRMTPDGQAAWSAIWDGPKIEAEQQAAANLRQHGVLVITEPPEGRVTSVGFHGVTIDDELLAQVSDLYRLLSLNAADSRITDDQLRCLAGLPQLVSLVLANTPITDAGLVHLRSLGNIEALHLAATGVSDRGMVDIGCLGQLKVLDLSGTKVTDEGLKHITSLGELRWLLLTGDEVTDAGLDALAVLTDLRRLSVGRTKITPAGVARLKQANPELSVDQ